MGTLADFEVRSDKKLPVHKLHGELTRKPTGSLSFPARNLITN